MALFDAHANLAYSTVATAPSPADTGTSLTVASGQGSRFPAVPFNATIWPQGAIATPTNAEIVRVTNVAGDVLTITRHQEGTSARSVIIGDQIANTSTNKTFTDLENTFTVTTQSGNYAILTTDTTIFVNAASAPVTITLPTAVGVTGKKYNIKKIDSSANAVTINTTSSQTIDADTSVIINVQYTSMQVISDGSNWFVV